MESEQRELSASRVLRYLLFPPCVRLHLRLRSTVYGLLFSPSRLSIARRKSDRLSDCLAYSLLQSTSTSRRPHWRLRLSCYQPITDQIEEGQRKSKGKATKSKAKPKKKLERNCCHCHCHSSSLLLLTLTLTSVETADVSAFSFPSLSSNCQWYIARYYKGVLVYITTAAAVIPDPSLLWIVVFSSPSSLALFVYTINTQPRPSSSASTHIHLLRASHPPISDDVRGLFLQKSAVLCSNRSVGSVMSHA